MRYYERHRSGACSATRLVEAVQLMWASAKRARFDDTTLVRALRDWKEAQALMGPHPHVSPMMDRS